MQIRNFCKNARLLCPKIDKIWWTILNLLCFCTFTQANIYEWREEHSVLLHNVYSFSWDFKGNGTIRQHIQIKDKYVNLRPDYIFWIHSHVAAVAHKDNLQLQGIMHVSSSF